MRNAKRGLAWLLSLLILVTALPTTALAEGTAGEAVQAEDAVDPVEETTGPMEEVPSPAEEVVYYSDTSRVTVTTDAAKAGTVDAEGNPYAVFDPDGSYTISLPAWTEFPIAVDFRIGERDFRIVYGNETETRATAFEKWRKK